MMAAAAPKRPELSERQTAVLQLASEGESRKAIARRLGVELSTVHEHFAQAHRKLGVRSTIHAVAKALRMGAIT
jgi:DNA-binding NarL/FixJ family response regulator